MLQPRLITPGCVSEKMGYKYFFVRSPRYWTILCVAILLSANLVTCQEINENEYNEGPRLKREGIPENRDLTVLLVNDQKRDYNTKIGRYHSVKPLIGLLTSTARTFIQDGVTTEYATQILGTTLDNGRIYAQLLTKSSLVLYNKPSNVDDPFIVRPTRVHSAFDGQWNVKQDLGIIDPDKFILKNTDYLAPSSKMDIVYASKLAKEPFKVWNPPSVPESQIDNQIVEEPTARRVAAYNEIPRYEVYNYLDGPVIEREKKFEFIVEPSIVGNTNYRQHKAYEPILQSDNVDKIEKEDIIIETNIVKVKPDYDLPTFTIKKEFSPIFYYIDNVESRQSPQHSTQQTKTPKKLFGQKSEPRPKKTFTYAGFADFTTVVGDTVIIFTPNTETIKPPNPDEVNVFPSAKPVDKLATKITFLSADIPVATATYNAHEVIDSTKTTSMLNSVESITEQPVYNDEESLKKVLYETDDQKSATVSVQYNNGFDFNLDVIQPSEISYTTTESIRPMEELEKMPIEEYNSQATEPLRTIQPSTIIPEQPKESVVTESNMEELFTNSEEETENTAAEVTERIDEAEDLDEKEDEEGTTEAQDFVTTTESGHSDESFEDIETTTETKHDRHEDIYCTDGFETQSTMTTAYKTLTYLTTYFIPLENTETTTSVESNIIVTSDMGYLTNVVCKTNINIEPTSVVSVEAISSEESSLDTPEVYSQSNDLPPIQLDVVTENPLKTTEMEKEILTTTQNEDAETVIDDTKSHVTNNIINEQSLTSTTDKITTNHIEVSVSTESSPTEKPVSEQYEDAQISENEIDLIYKTLYTTYTYFTTFFGDHTSSVASHKSVVTNIITSTVDLTNLDPALLGAFGEDNIIPTSVEQDQSTQTLAINSIIDLVKNKDVIESVENDGIYNSQTPTPSLGDDIINSIKPDSVKTYFTTYTFFTTIYVGSDANVCSRSEVYTNYVGPDELVPTKSNPLLTENTRAQFDFRNCKQIKREQESLTQDDSSETTNIKEDNSQALDDLRKDPIQPSPIEVDMLLSIESNPLESDNIFVTDVKSSSSKGDRKIIDNNNIILDDQISSESNIDEILPSPTLLLQTSYTTFTYFTTMYIGKDSSNIKSRLETITNVVTETITPKAEAEEENNLPITYYTTFTYWTTLCKDKSTTITSREEIVSNVVTPSVQTFPTISPIDTTPIDIDSIIPQKELEVGLKPSVIGENLEQDDGKATFYTTYTYFTTFYAGNISQIRSSLKTVTNIVENSQVIEDNQLGRKVGAIPADKNLIQGSGGKIIEPSIVKEEIKPTKIPDISTVSSTLLLGTYIDNLYAEVKPPENSKLPEEKKILFSQVAVISGDSTIVTSDNKTLNENTTPGSTTTSTSTTTTTEESIISPTSDVLESSVAETTTESKVDQEEEDDESNPRKKGRLTFTTKKPSFTPVIIPFASRNRPTFSPKRVPLLSSATTITRADSTPTITATPTLKSVRPSGFGGTNRKQSALPVSSGPGRRFSGRSSSINLSANVPSASRSGGFGRASIQPSSRRTGFRSSSVRSNSLDYASRSAIPRIRPTASSRLRNSRQSSTLFFPPNEQTDSETSITQIEENVTESLDEVTETLLRTTPNPLLKFRRPPIARQPGTAILPRSSTPTVKRSGNLRGRTTTTTTKRTTRRSTSNPLLTLRRERPNSLFPRRNLFKQPEPEPEKEIKENDQKVEDEEELLEEEEFEEDNDYESSDRKEQQVATPSTLIAKKNNIVQIRPFAFRRRTKRQVDYGNRKLINFRRPGLKPPSTRRPEPEPETEAPAPVTQKQKTNRYNGRNSKTTTVTAPKSSSRQSFIVRGESRTTSTTSSPAYRRGKTRTSSRTTTTHSSRPKAPRLSNKSSDRTRSGTGRTSTSRARTRTTTSRGSSRQKSSFENFSAERHRQDTYNNLLHDGKITITHQIPIEVTIPIVNGKITEYKNLLSAKPSTETLLLNQVSTSIGPLGNQQLVLAIESTELADNGATKITKYVLHETPTTTVIFTPTTIRGRKTSYSHVLPSTVYNVEPVVQTISPEINANVPLANLLLSQLLLGNQQPAINPLLALQGQALLPQQPIVQTPVTEYKTRTTTFVTTVTDARETVLPITFRAFNTNGIVFDNSPWRPGRDIPIEHRELSEDNERKLKNVATRIMSNGVEVLVTDKSSDGKQDQVNFMEIKTIQPSLPSNMFVTNFPKIDKRIDQEENIHNFDLIQPSEVSQPPCSTSCSCSNTKTESLKTKYASSLLSSEKYNTKTSNVGFVKIDVRPTHKESVDKNTQYNPYGSENNVHSAPTDKIVEKYTEVINDYSDEKDSNTIKESDLLTNEQAPIPSITNKLPNIVTDKTKPEKVIKINKNKFVVADLLKLGSLSIKGLSQLAPVIEKMTDTFMKRQEYNNANKTLSTTTTTTTTTTTMKPVKKLTSYTANKRIDSDFAIKHNKFPIYIPIDEMETSESQIAFRNATLHQNFAWATEFKQPKGNIPPPKIIHESPLVNGGIPISPGEIITANSDVIVGKPAVGRPLTLAASGIKLQNPVNHPPIDNYMSNSESFAVQENTPTSDQPLLPSQLDDSFDLRPPDLPRIKPKPNRDQHQSLNTNNNIFLSNKKYQTSFSAPTKEISIENHGRPMFLDYIPAFTKPANKFPLENHVDFQLNNKDNEKDEMLDNSPSSSEVISSSVTTDGEYAVSVNPDSLNKPFLVDIQPSRVANVIIPHGSSTALVFAGSSEPHKTGEYIDDPLPYPEPGYFGSFSIDAPQMTNVHNVVPNNKQFLIKSPNLSLNPVKHTSPIRQEHQIRNDLKIKWNNNKGPIGLNKLPPPVSNQETFMQMGPEVIYNTDRYKLDNQKLTTTENDKSKSGKEIIDREYENYLAVPPPPPPPKNHFNHENRFDKNKPYSQRPVIHSQPMQDMNVFLNAQRPTTKVTTHEHMPPKITSEVYFAAQSPNTKPTSIYTVHLPPTPSVYGKTQIKMTANSNTQSSNNAYPHIGQSVFKVIPMPNTEENQSYIHGDRKNTRLSMSSDNVPIGANNKETIHGLSYTSSSPINTLSQLGQLNTDIPIGTNIAMKVEDDPIRFESSAIHSNTKPEVSYDDFKNRPTKVMVHNNQWNKTVPHEYESIYNKNDNIIQSHYIKEVYPSIGPSLNSHANFPMINDYSVSNTQDFNTKNNKIVDSVKVIGEEKRPAKLMPNISTNSHGWYSSVVFNENNLKNINNIQVEATTRKIIPISYDYNNNQLPEFGQKITSIGKPPVWQNVSVYTSSLNIGKPFTKTQEYESQSTSAPKLLINTNYRPNYLPSNSRTKQPVYDIPLRNPNQETTTINIIKIEANKNKPIYENSEEIYDGEEEGENESADTEVSMESMKIPVVTSSGENDNNSQKSGILKHRGHGFVPQKSSLGTTTSNKTKPYLNHNTQTEKPFSSYNGSEVIQSHAIRQIGYDKINYMKPRPFTVNTISPLDHQLQQPHWQINQLMENSSNMSYEENLDLNIGEGFSTTLKSVRHEINSNVMKENNEIEKLNMKHSINKIRYNKTQIANETANIITSTVHIKDKKPLVLEVTEKSTLPSFTITNNLNNTQPHDILNLSPPPPVFDFNFKPSTKDEYIMGMSPPPQKKPPSMRVTPRPLVTRPILPPRTPPPLRTLPPRTLPPRTQRPNQKPYNNDEISTYRPTYDIVNKLIQSNIKLSQPSSQLLPPLIATKVDMQQPLTTISSLMSNVVFPTSLSSSWMTSAGIDFSSKFNFAPTSIKFPHITKPSKVIEISKIITSEKPDYSYENEFSGEIFNGPGFIKSDNNTDSKEIIYEMSKESSKEKLEIPGKGKLNITNGISHESSEKVKVISLVNKNRTRKPYPVRNDDKRTSTTSSKLQLPSINITPSKIVHRPEVVYPPRVSTIRNNVRPTPSRSIVTLTTPILESSESSIIDDFTELSEVLKQTDLPTMVLSDINTSIENINTATPFIYKIPNTLTNQPIHHAGNEIKISDDIIPTKTEFKTTVITLTKTLSEPPKTVSSIGYVNLTHTLTVTHTETSLVSQSEGAITQTLVITNTQTSTMVDVVTKIQTQVQPTTIVETVTKHIPVLQVRPSTVQEVTKTKGALDDISMSSEESDNFIIKDNDTTENIQKIEYDGDNDNDNDTFFVVMNKSQNGGKSPPLNKDIETGDYDGITRNEQVNSNGVSQVLFGEILLAGTPYLETTNVVHPPGYGKECHPDCKASRNERCQRIDSIMKCVCRPGFARMFPDRPCKPTYTYSVNLALSSQGHERLQFHESLSDNSSKEYNRLAVATHEGINRMIMQSDLRDVYHGIHITGFHSVEMTNTQGEKYHGVINDFYVQLSDNAHENRLKEVIEKYLRNNNYSLGGTDVYAAGELMDKLDVSDFDECVSPQFHDCSEYSQCFNLRGTYTCSCLEGYADLSVNPQYPGRICSAEPVGCERCNYHGACYSRDDHRVLCECFQWYAGSSCQINLKVVLISLVVLGALLTVVLAVCAVVACSRRPRPQQRSIVACIQGMPSLHQGAAPTKQRADRRALINDRTENGDASSVQNASLPYLPSKRPSSSKKCVSMSISEPPAHAPPPPPAPAVIIPRARLHPHHSDSRDNLARKRSLELISEAKLISYLESGATINNDEMRRKHSIESSYSTQKDRHNKQGALVSAGFKVSTTIRPDETVMDRDRKEDREDLSSINKTDTEGELSRFNTLRKSYSQEDMSEWTDAERRIGELTLSEARSVGGTLPASTGRAASSTRLTHQEANTMAERDLGSTFLLPHVHLYKPDFTSDVSEFDSL